MTRLTVACTLLCSLAAAQTDAEARKGYTHRDGGFAGTFADLLSTVQLTVDGDHVVGTCDRGAAWQLDGTIRDGVLTGRATCLVAKEAFAAHFVGDRMLVKIGDLETPFARVVALDTKLAELGAPVVDAERQWTIAIYLGGDNNLEEAAIDDWDEMLKELPVAGVEVCVLLDRREHKEQQEGVWSDTRVFRLPRKAGEDVEVLALPGELDTGNAQTLAGFVTGVFRKYPAPHRAVLLWDHGSGWGGVVSDRNAPGSPRGRNMLSLTDIRVALQTAQLRVQMAQKFDLVLFDACLMAHLETAVAVMDSADWLVASQAIVPGSGYPYGKVLPAFLGSMDAREICQRIVAAFGSSYDAENDSSVTLSAIELARAPRIAALLDRFATALLPVIDDNWTALGRAMFYGESYQPRTKRRTGGWIASLDLLDTLRRIRDTVKPFPADATAALALLEQECGAAVVARHAGAQRSQSHGLSVFAPYRETDRLLPYAQTALGAGNRWTALLTKLHILSLGEHSPVTIADVALAAGKDGDRTVVRPFHGDGVTFTVTGRALVEVEQQDCVQDGEGWVVLRKNLVHDRDWPRRLEQAVADEADRLMPAFVDGVNALTIELTGMQYLIDNRGDTLRRATMDLSAPSSQSPIVVQAQMATAEPPGHVDVEILFDRAWWRAIVVVPLHCPEDEMEERAFKPAATTEFQFVLETLTKDGTRDRVLSDPMAWGKGLWLVLDRDEPGQYRARVEARTLDGRTQTASFDYELAANPDLELWVASWGAFDREQLTGTWPQSRVTGPEQWTATKAAARFVGPSPLGPGVFDVETVRGDGDGISRQTWLFEQRGVPNLRVITEEADGRTFCWYGPAAWGKADEQPFLVMKALNVPNVLWRWQRAAAAPPDGNVKQDGKQGKK